MKSKSLKQMLSSALALCMVIMSVVPASAQVSSTESLNGPGTSQATVSYSIGSSYTVTIPKTIYLEGTADNASSTYEVTVTGDLAAGETLGVYHSSSVHMTQGDKGTVEASVSQNKTEWTHADLKPSSSAQGSIQASGFSAGTWTGVLDFVIELK